MMVIVFRVTECNVYFNVFLSVHSCTLNTFNPLNAELNSICYLLALLAHHFLHVSRIRVNLPTECTSLFLVSKVHPCTGTEALYRPYGPLRGVEV